MTRQIERRSCRRFEIPDTKVRYKKNGLLGFFKGFSEPSPLLNISKGGLAFFCEEKLGKGKKIMLELLAPNETPLNLRARVRWQGHPAGKVTTVVGVQFMPFGSGNSWNSLETLEVLKRLDEQYGEGDQDDCGVL